MATVLSTTMDGTQLQALAALARDSIHDALGAGDPPARATAWSACFDAAGAAFVTLTRDGRLRGCVGTLEAWRPLAADVAANARGAAFADPRFAPLTVTELACTMVEISVLQPAPALTCADAATLLAELRPGIDGLTVRYGAQRATYLPAVWAQLPNPARFLAELRRKAAIPAHVPLGDLELERYVTVCSPRIALAVRAR